MTINVNSMQSITRAIMVALLALAPVAALGFLATAS